jgi:spore maturation protein CgeB
MQVGPRLVIASELWFGSTPDGLAHGFRKIGWDVCLVDMRSHFLQSHKLALRLLGRATRQLSAASYNEAILRSVDAFKPCAFVTVKGTSIWPATLMALKSRGIIAVNYYPDFHFDHSGLDPSTFRLYDRFITTKSFQLDDLKRRLEPCRVSFLHHGYGSHVHYPRSKSVSHDDYVCDVGYAGAYSPYKARWLLAVARRLPGLHLRIMGPGWRRPTLNTELERYILGHELTGDSYCRALQHSRINLAIHFGPAERSDWQDNVSTRTFEIPACRGFMLHIDNAEVRELFEPGREIDVFSTEEELCEKIRHYLGRPELRGEMIERAYERCVPAYSYDARAKAIANEIISFG